MADDTPVINMDALKILEICRDIELGCANLYKYYAEIFSNHEEMSALWNKTAEEENNHARQFVLVINLQRKRNLIDSLRTDGSASKNMLHIVNSVYDEVKKNKPSMLEALELAIRLEEKLQGCHMTTAVNFVEESHQELFSAMMRADNRHVEDLQAFYRQLSAV